MLGVQTVKVSKNIKNDTKLHPKFNEKSIQKTCSKKESQNMKTHQKSDPQMKATSIKNHSKNRFEKRDEKKRSKTLEPGMAKCASSPHPIISKDILRSEVRRKQTKKAD